MDDSEADLVIGIDAGSEQIGRIPRADATIRGVFGEITLVEGRAVQTHANARQSMLVAVDTSQGFPPALGSAVDILRVDWHLPFGCPSFLPVYPNTALMLEAKTRRRQPARRAASKPLYPPTIFSDNRLW